MHAKTISDSRKVPIQAVKAGRQVIVLSPYSPYLDAMPFGDLPVSMWIVMLKRCMALGACASIYVLALLAALIRFAAPLSVTHYAPCQS